MADNEPSELFEVETVAVLEQGIASWKENNSITDWPERLSIKPILFLDEDTGVSSTVGVAVQAEDGDATTCMPWLQTGENGVESVVFLTPDQAQEIFNEEAAGALREIQNNINPFTGEAPPAETELSWYNPNTKERRDAIEDITDEQRAELESQGFKEVYFRPSVLDDPKVAALHEQLLEFNEAVKVAQGTSAAASVPQSVIDESNQATVASAPDADAPAADEEEPQPDGVPGLQNPGGDDDDEPEAADVDDAPESERDPALERLRVYLPEELPDDQMASADLMYQTAVKIMNGVRGVDGNGGGRVISPEQLDELIEQFRGTEAGDKYAAELEKLKQDPMPNILEGLSGIGGAEIDRINGENRPEPEEPAAEEPDDGAEVADVEQQERPSFPGADDRPENWDEMTPEQRNEWQQEARQEWLDNMIKNGDPEHGRRPVPVMGADGGVVLVDLGEDNGGIHALWKDSEGNNILLDEQELRQMTEAAVEEMSAFNDDGNSGGAIAMLRQVKVLSQSSGDIMKLQVENGDADVDATGANYEGLSEQEIADKATQAVEAAIEEGQHSAAPQFNNDSAPVPV